jgi:hypothetical protein
MHSETRNTGSIAIVLFQYIRQNSTSIRFEVKCVFMVWEQLSFTIRLHGHGIVRCDPCGAVTQNERQDISTTSKFSMTILFMLTSSALTMTSGWFSGCYLASNDCSANKRGARADLKLCWIAFIQSGKHVY